MIEIFSEEKMANLKKDIKDLRNNPVFNMSLSGKELFHSNMLAMFLQDKKNQDTDNLDPSSLALEMMKIFKPKLDTNEQIEEYQVFDVLREKKNRDLIILYAKKEKLTELTTLFKEIPSIEDFSDETFNSIENWKLNCDETNNLHEILKTFKCVVIENKFKSYPYKEQLENYNNSIDVFPNLPHYTKTGTLAKTKSSIALQNTEYYLLAPKMTLDLFCDKNLKTNNYEIQVRQNIWHGIAYDENEENSYLKNLGKVKIEDNFLETFRNHYCKYTQKILDICKTINMDINKDGKFFFSSEQSFELKKGRIHDVCQKILSNWLMEKLKKEIPSFVNYENKKYLVASTGYEHQSGFLDFRFKNKKNHIFHGIQIQGSSFGIFVVADYRTFSSEEAHIKKYLSDNFKNNQDEIKAWINVQFSKIKTIFNSKSDLKINQNNLYKKDRTLFGYTVEDQYCHRYGSIDLNMLAKSGDFRDIDYSTIKTLLEVSLEILSETSFELKSN